MTKKLRTTSRRRRAFTLLEMVVAVGAVALISVGLASIFRAVGKTVAGGKRVSLVTNYASLLETRMRADFANLTRRGPMVIRQQWVDRNNNQTIDANDVVPLSRGGSDQAGASTSRPRRIDEIVFFEQGSFTSERRSPIPGLVVTSNEARVYYGHGQQRDLTATADDEPKLDDHNAGATNQRSLLGQGGDSNPNHFAGDWTLLRHVTLLVKPETAPKPGTDPTVSILGVAATSGRLNNKPTQIGLLPAASSVFRSVMANVPNLSTAARYSGAPRDNPKLLFRDVQNNADIHPRFSSGTIDIATTNLNEIRSMILGNCTSNSGGRPTLPQWVWQNQFLNPLVFDIPVTNAASPPSRPAAASATSLDVMQAWMDDLMPTQSWTDGASAIYPAPNAQADDPPGVRMRCEAMAPSLDQVMQDAATAANAGNSSARRMADAEKTDREAVTLNNLLPKCSEFKVEWSFGDPDPDPTRAGQVVWFGLKPYDPADMTSPAPYPFTPSYSSSQMVVHRVPLTLRRNANAYDVTPRLIYGDPPAAGDLPSTLTSYFGYVDPTYKQVSTGTDPETIPWAWPKLIRVTVSVADRNDPTYEASFQFVFALPEGEQTQ
ncbi:MAG: hypothetical protein GC200_03540 [Tepidisphaera sp.]|nr:hypothetical protein [Tepidisphaera sp.]